MPILSSLKSRWTELAQGWTCRSDQDLLAEVLRIRDGMRRVSREQLLADSLSLRETRAVERYALAPSRDVVVQGLSLMWEALRRACGVELYDLQLRAALGLLRGDIVEMQTGEGKTFSCAPAAYLRALSGKGVHVATPNFYLAERDCQLLQPAFAMLGVTAGLLPERADDSAKRTAYRCDITYGSGYEFGFDYLRDQIALQRLQKVDLGRRLLDALNGDAATLKTIQRPLYCAVVDEADQVLLDDAGSPLVLSGEATRAAPDAAACELASRIAESLLPEQHYTLNLSTRQLRLQSPGIERIHQSDIRPPLRTLARPWSDYVEQALRARWLYQRDVHYVVVDDQVRIVDDASGRIFADRTWRDGLHQAIQTKEGLPVLSDGLVLAQITRQRFYRQYPLLSGMTGTAAGCESELRRVYRTSVASLPPRLPSRRVIHPLRSFASSEQKWSAVVESVRHYHDAGRPVLIGAHSILDSQHLAELLAEAGLPVDLLNGRQDAQEADVIARAGRPKAITIATNLAGRGTDIKLHDSVGELGGLHVIVAECHESRRVDRQLIGRCARQGDPGSSQTFVSAEDSLLQRYAPWLADWIRSTADQRGEVYLDLTPRIQRIQRLAEQSQYAARAALLRLDLARDSLLAEPIA